MGLDWPEDVILETTTKTIKPTKGLIKVGKPSKSGVKISFWKSTLNTVIETEL